MTDEGSETTPPTAAPDGRTGDAGALGPLPRLNGRQVRLARAVGPAGPDPGRLLGAWGDLLGAAPVADRFEFIGRAAGLRRPGAVAQLAWPRLATRAGVGFDPPLAHALVDRLLGFERTLAEGRLQVSPVEWGVLSFLVAAALHHLERRDGPLGPWDLTIDRVGPDPFDAAGLGPVVTFRWRVAVGDVVGSARLWLPETLLDRWLDVAGPAGPAAAPVAPGDWAGRFGDVVAEWRAVAGTATVAATRLARALAAGRLLLLDGHPLGGTVASPAGAVRLVQDGPHERRWYEAVVEPGSAAARLILTSRARTRPSCRTPAMTDPHEPRPTSPAPDPATEADPTPPGDELAVTLTVELGRVNVPLGRLAALRPGDVVELARHPREPVELTSNGRLVARGELVQVDTELAVRVLHTYL